MNLPKTYYIDFDHTLFDTKRFNQDLIKDLFSVLNNGCSSKDNSLSVDSIQGKEKMRNLAKDIENEFKRYREENKYFWQNQERKTSNNILDVWGSINNIAEYIEQNHGLDKEISLKVIENIVKDHLTQNNKGTYIFDDVIPFLEYIKKGGNNIYLLTHSTDPIFQIDKIKSSGIVGSGLKGSGNKWKTSPGYFEQIIIATGGKSNIKDIDYENGIFIDDRMDVVNDLIKNGTNPNNIILISREPFDLSKQVDIPKGIKVISSLKDLMNNSK